MLILGLIQPHQVECRATATANPMTREGIFFKKKQEKVFGIK